MREQGFFAFPDGYDVISEAVQGVVQRCKDKPLTIKSWRAMKIIGFKLDDRVRASVAGSAVLVADITYSNANVLYEMGYAIGLGKPVIPTLNTAIEGAIQRTNRLGLFDTIGWATYTNADELSDILQDHEAVAWTNTLIRRKNHSQPLFILDTQAKIDFRNHIFQAVEHSEVEFRRFDPTELPRLTAADAIADVSCSAGVIVPLLGAEIVDSLRHNLRASFILGLCHGFGVEVLAIQYGNGPAPTDYRDFITNSTFGHETQKHVGEFASKVLIWNQRSSSRENKFDSNLLSAIDLGSAMAENETQRLSEYFLPTAAFSRALRAEGAVVIGRKGAGKSAIYLQIVSHLSRDKRVCIVDLRPASHNLSEMRESIWKVESAGVFDHTVAAFWQYVLYVEILLKLREMALGRARNDFKLQERVRDIESTFKLTVDVVAGDFTSRLRAAVDGVIEVMGHIEDSDEVRSRITNAMFERFIPQLRSSVASFRDIADEIVILIDDLDKGWPARRVEALDVSTVKHLIESLNRIQRDLRRNSVSLRHLLFLRSDIYEKLVQETSDRGKYNVVRVDWSDQAALRNLIRERVVSSVELTLQGDAWKAMNPQISDGDTLSLLIDNSLRRPRFLIDLCEKTISCAINRGHISVQPQDVEEGLRLMARYLVSDFAYEMRDVAGTPENILYLFIGASELLAESEIHSILRDSEIGMPPQDVVELLLWYGFLGFMSEGSTALFIYDVEYDYRRLDAERMRLRGDVLYVVNSAFLRGLSRAG